MKDTEIGVSETGQAAPKIFISYSWTSDEHASWVLELATRLRGSYVDVILDRWDLKPGQDKFHFMEQMATDPEIQKVLVVCDGRYTQRADRREGGVGTESTIISQEVYNRVRQDKFIPIVAERAEDGEPFLPVFLKSRIYIDLSDPRRFEAGYEDLLREIGGQPVHVKPPLGKPPSFLTSNAATPPTTHAKRAFEDALLRDKRHATGLAVDYFDALFEVLQLLRFDKANPPTKDEMPSAITTRLDEWSELRDELVAFLRFVSQYGNDQRLFDTIPRFFERSLKLMTGRYSDGINEHLNFIVHEAFLYTVTVLLEEERFETIDSLLTRHYRDGHEEGSFYRYGVFSHGETRRLETIMQSIWNARYEHPMSALLSRRATNDLITFEALRETDFILYLRYLVENKGDFTMLSWYPETLGSLDRPWNLNFQFPNFARAKSRRYFEKFKTVLGASSKNELLEQWERIFPPKSGAYENETFSLSNLFRRLTYLDQLDSI